MTNRPKHPNLPSNTINTTKGIPIDIWQPRINGTFITSKEQLCELIEDEYLGLKSNPQFIQLLEDAKRHFDLITKFQNQRYIQYGDITRLAKEVFRERTYDGARLLVAAYIRNARRPLLYRFIDQCLSKSECQIKLDNIQRRNCEICTAEEVKHRLATYYPAKALTQSPYYKHRLSQVHKYFRALRLLKDGGLISDIARKLGILKRNLQQWLNNQSRPDLVTLAGQIPKEDPGSGNKWLPMKTKPGYSFKPAKFIKVPLTLKDWDQLRDVLNQLIPLDNNMQTRKKRFGHISKEQAFIYIMGILVSDAAKQQKGNLSIGFELGLSKKYSWSEMVGEYACYCLGKLGIEAKRSKDYINPNTLKERYWWRSKISPFLRWIMESCLGIFSNERTSYDPIRADWLLNAPDEIRLKFLQGLNDGDGYVTIKGQQIGISSGINGSFIRKLLKTFGIDSRYDGIQVIIARQESIIRAAQLPFFLNATGRQEKAKKFVKMIRMRKKMLRRRVSEEIIKYILKLHKEGKSYGQIIEIIFDKYGFSYRISRVRDIIKAKATKG